MAKYWEQLLAIITAVVSLFTWATSREILKAQHRERVKKELYETFFKDNSTGAEINPYFELSQWRTVILRDVYKTKEYPKNDGCKTEIIRMYPGGRCGGIEVTSDFDWRDVVYDEETMEGRISLAGETANGKGLKTLHISFDNIVRVDKWGDDESHIYFKHNFLGDVAESERLRVRLAREPSETRDAGIYK